MKYSKWVLDANGFDINNSSGELIAHCYPEGDGWCPDEDVATAEDNARLMVAAPDLLEALQDALECMISEYNTLADKNAPDYNHPYIPKLLSKIGKAKLAIAKAEGK